MEPKITIEASGSAGWHEMVALRQRVLRTPLGLTFSEQELSAETGQIHLALWLSSGLAGTLLLLPPDPDGQAKLRQMAIRPDLERRGLGALLMRHGENRLRLLGAASAWLAARESAVGFYERMGYAVEGNAFIEVTLPHRRMARRLDLDDRPILRQPGPDTPRPW